MDSEEFASKYPLISINLTNGIQPQNAEARKAIHNIECIIDTLPLHERIILNQLGTSIIIGNEGCYAKYIHTQAHQVNAPYPKSIHLDIETFSSFNYRKNDPTHDRQRDGEATIHEEVTHALGSRLPEAPQWQTLAREELKSFNPERNRALQAARLYSSYTAPQGVFIKQSLEKYYANTPQDRTGDEAIATELPAEINAIRHILRDALKYGNKRVFTQRPDIQEIMDYYHTILSQYPPDAPEAAIESVLRQHIFRKTYPTFADHERRLKEQAEDIVKNPAAYPVLGRMTGAEYDKFIVSPQDEGWQRHFKDFLVSPPEAYLRRI